MQPLKLPEFDIRTKDNEVFCLVRKQWVVLTPEEWVRQHFLNLLISHLSYPKGMIKLEHSHSYFGKDKRSDITILNKEMDVFMLVECKAASVPINQKVIDQVSQYNRILDAKYVAVTNGLKHFIWEGGKQLTDFPKYGN